MARALIDHPLEDEQSLIFDLKRLSSPCECQTTNDADNGVNERMLLGE
eukprot:CAMPEP_0203681620 /NCGR_PEP_ID=MMETSP0090-20130426/43269_1 /ASSEMBLY_ACC=CAM_ASM_001088 /TAXON_ID=426623 /ORGANISM="Chaetoceros affinis, Strain CCMP159" /LENGTH=47 /DNA_ID= /DNA_START= /DNA_END= /DNA_ORIENTATION=